MLWSLVGLSAARLARLLTPSREGGGGTGQTDGQTDGRTDGQTGHTTHTHPLSRSVSLSHLTPHSVLVLWLLYTTHTDR